jgi:hypothetical protein
MLERGVDQATGLRRSMTPHGGPVLPVAGAGECEGGGLKWGACRRRCAGEVRNE